jgi:Ca2+-transporting ATPase
MNGVSEILTRKSTRHVMVHRDEVNDVPGSTGVETSPVEELEKDNISCTITFYASQTLHTIA